MSVDKPEGVVSGVCCPDIAPPPDPIMQYFAWEHLPPELGVVSHRFAELAWYVHNSLPRCAERTVALRKLLEGKDAAVRTLVLSK